MPGTDLPETPLSRQPSTGPPLAPTVPVHSRWKASEITFGPVGRIVATGLVLVPVLYGLFVNVFFLVAAGIWCFLLPGVLRDIWRRTRVGERPSLDGVTVPAREPEEENMIGRRQAPRRW
jgi:hypothetical protein